MTIEREEQMTLTVRGSLHRITDPENLDASVRDVFGTMLGVPCDRDTRNPAMRGSESNETVTAVVGFGGVLSGACVVLCDGLTARQMVARMTGLTFESIDDTVKDGMGEICNMIAGTWKSRIPDLAAQCGLSVPAVITGRDYNLHVQAPQFELRGSYTFEDSHFELSITCEGLR